MKEKKSSSRAGDDAAKWSSIRGTMEHVATFGLILIAVGLAAPISGYAGGSWMSVFKIVTTCGAVIYFVARLVQSLGRDESFRIRRIRRMEAWAGLSFCVGAFFWIYNTRGFSGLPTYHMLQETIVFVLAGAAIQIVAVWMKEAAMKRQVKEAVEARKAKAEAKAKASGTAEDSAKKNAEGGAEDNAEDNAEDGAKGKGAGKDKE